MRFRLIHHDRVDSTSERAFDALERGEARDGDVHVARGQSAGRGRRGRTWVSPEGEGLYASLVLLPPPPALRPEALTLAAGLALLGLARDLGIAADLDWPNDLVVGGAKLAGVLIETRGRADTRPHFVLGVGINVLQESFPAALAAERPVTSLALLGVRREPGEVLALLLGRLPARLEQARREPQRLLDDFLRDCELRGSAVSVEAPDGSLRGELIGLSLAGGLELREEDGATRRVPLAHVRGLTRL